jgi:hypothetical protein
MGYVMYVMILYDKLRHSLSLRRLHSLRMVRVDAMQRIFQWLNGYGWLGEEGKELGMQNRYIEHSRINMLR